MRLLCCATRCTFGARVLRQQRKEKAKEASSSCVIAWHLKAAANGGQGGTAALKKRDADGKFKGTCHAFQVGKCKFGEDCKFEHACENCGLSGHGRAECPKLATE